MSSAVTYKRNLYKVDNTLIDLSEVIFIQVATDSQEGAWINLTLRNGVTVNTNRMPISRASNIFNDMVKTTDVAKHITNAKF